MQTQTTYIRVNKSIGEYGIWEFKDTDGNWKAVPGADLALNATVYSIGHLLNVPSITHLFSDNISAGSKA